MLLLRVELNISISDFIQGFEVLRGVIINILYYDANGILILVFVILFWDENTIPEMYTYWHSSVFEKPSS